MKNAMSTCRLPLLSAVLAVTLAGCVGISKSPPSRFYFIQTVTREKSEMKYDKPANVIIGIGPVKVPEYLKRPQIATVGESNRLHFAEFDRWGEPLDLSLPRIMAANLAALLPQATIETSPWNLLMPVKYQVIITVTSLESHLNQDLSLAAQWAIIDLDTKAMVESGKSRIKQPVERPGYSGLAAALSMAWASLSTEIAGRLAALPNRPDDANIDNAQERH